MSAAGEGYAAGFCVRVLHNCEAEKDDELSLVAGEIIECVVASGSTLWEGTYDGRRGLFPVRRPLMAISPLCATLAACACVYALVIIDMRATKV